MSHTTTLRRTASALGATALLGVVLAAPALASQDAGSGGTAVSSSTDDFGVYGLSRGEREGTSSSTTTDDSGVYGLPRAQREGDTSWIDRNRQLGGFTFTKEVSTLPDSVTTPSSPSLPKVVRIDDDAVEYLQVAAGLLTGVAIAAAGAVVVTRRNQGGLTPA